jgi:hypothetical protein
MTAHHLLPIPSAYTINNPVIISTYVNDPCSLLSISGEVASDLRHKYCKLNSTQVCRAEVGGCRGFLLGL